MFRYRGAILGEFKNKGSEAQHVNLDNFRIEIF